MEKLLELKERLKPGKVFRRKDMNAWSKAVDRHLRLLVEKGELEKLSGGLYYVPRETSFGKAPAIEEELLTAFLKDKRFVVVSPNDYNSLGVGTSQLYNTRRVYNYKRHGKFKLGNRIFDFVRKTYVPEKLTKEFLLVDLANNLKHLAEDQPALVENVKSKAKEFNKNRLNKMAEYFGTVATRKLLASAN